MTPLRIAIVVHGRFHGFDLARALLALGHHVTVFTNYPRWTAQRFKLPRGVLRSAWMHGVMTYVTPRLPLPSSLQPSERWQHTAFGAWAARALEREFWDVIHCWSGVSEELLMSPRISAGCRMLMRGSAHIAVQDRLLAEEERRAGLRASRPSQWMIAREQREYALADRVVVLSSFARESFLAEGIPPDRVAVVALGVDVRAFAPSESTRTTRRVRIESGKPLRVIYVGALTLRKGLADFLEVARRLERESFEFRLVGPSTEESRTLLANAPSNVVHGGKIDQSRLPEAYHDADLFMFPTIEDGFGMVLTQALGAGLPVLCTTNCAGPDLIVQGENGWVLPVRSPEAFVERLRWCDAHRRETARIAENVATTFRPDDWAHVGKAFIVAANECLDTVRTERAR